jgi:hypothetical protein
VLRLHKSDDRLSRLEYTYSPESLAVNLGGGVVLSLPVNLFSYGMKMTKTVQDVITCVTFQSLVQKTH